MPTDFTPTPADILAFYGRIGEPLRPVRVAEHEHRLVPGPIKVCQTCTAVVVVPDVSLMRCECRCLRDLHPEDGPCSNCGAFKCPVFRPRP